MRYHVNISQNAKSSRGKLRAKKSNNKIHKKKRLSRNSGREGEDENCIGYDREDGIVEPEDVLCTITLSNGGQYEFKCCVSGTVLELNQRLFYNRDNGDVMQEDAKGTNNNEMYRNQDVRLVQADLSLLLNDPLLDGYLAVIMPRGAFPSRT